MLPLFMLLQLAKKISLIWCVVNFVIYLLGLFFLVWKKLIFYFSLKDFFYIPDVFLFAALNPFFRIFYLLPARVPSHYGGDTCWWILIKHKHSQLWLLTSDPSHNFTVMACEQDVYGKAIRSLIISFLKLHLVSLLHFLSNSSLLLFELRELRRKKR